MIRRRYENTYVCLAVSVAKVSAVQEAYKMYRPAFLKLWSADHKWSSGSALVVLLD